MLETKKRNGRPTHTISLWGKSQLTHKKHTNEREGWLGGWLASWLAGGLIGWLALTSWLAGKLAQLPDGLVGNLAGNEV